MADATRGQSRESCGRVLIGQTAVACSYIDVGQSKESCGKVTLVGFETAVTKAAKKLEKDKKNKKKR